MSTEQTSAGSAPPGLQHAANAAQRALLRALHHSFEDLLQAVEVQDLRRRGLVLTMDAINAATDKYGNVGLISAKYRDCLFVYALQGVRRVATAVQRHFNVQPSDMQLVQFHAFTRRRERPPDDASIKDQWRWAIKYHLDMCDKWSICLGVVDSVLKFCTLEEPTIARFKKEDDYLLPLVPDSDRAWKDERRKYAGHALFALARLLAFRFRGKEVKVLEFSTSFP